MCLLFLRHTGEACLGPEPGAGIQVFQTILESGIRRSDETMFLVNFPPGCTGPKPANKKVSGVVILSEAKNLLPAEA
jgi:hypothetical protein